MLLEEFLKPMSMTQKELFRGYQVSISKDKWNHWWQERYYSKHSSSLGKIFRDVGRFLA